jgi:hypothetical protein
MYAQLWPDKTQQVISRMQKTRILQHNIHNPQAHFIKSEHFNLLKPTGHVMNQQFNIQQLYALPTLYLCVLYLSENKQRLVPLTA